MTDKKTDEPLEIEPQGVEKPDPVTQGFTNELNEYELTAQLQARQEAKKQEFLTAYQAFCNEWSWRMSPVVIITEQGIIPQLDAVPIPKAG